MTNFGISSRNEGQKRAFRTLANKEHDVVFLTGKAGTGKNIIAVAYALEQVLEERNFKSVIYTRNPVEMGKELGFLPGTAEEKTDPYFAPFHDSLSAITDIRMDIYFGKEIQLEPAQFMRGRTFHDSLLIIDEAQNFDLHTLAGILTRLGEGSKAIVIGNFSQIDVKEYREPENNGLYTLLNGMYHQEDRDIFAHVHLTKGERSRIADVVEGILYRENEFMNPHNVAQFTELEGRGEEERWETAL